MSALLDAANAWHDAGCCVVPAKADGSKHPHQAWKQFQTVRSTPEALQSWFEGKHFDGLGIITGAVSGNVEMFEIEGRAQEAGIGDQLATLMRDNGVEELWRRITDGYLEQTPSGGYHWLLRVEGGPTRPNTKLAQRPATDRELAEWKTTEREKAHTLQPEMRAKRLAVIDRTSHSDIPQVLIETRGEGGFTIVAPSAGRTHINGQPWRVVMGKIGTIPTVTVDERDLLYAIATMLDETPAATEPTPRPTSATRDSSDLRPGDDYNQRADWADILTPHGWAHVTTFHGGARGWRRPGKSNGMSATTGRNDGDNLYVFSSSTLFETHKAYSKFAAYALLEHDGNYARAASALAAAGYGTPRTPGPDLRLVVNDGPPTPIPAENVRSKFPTLDWHALWADQDEEEWIVEPLLPARRLIALYSAPKVGKSLLMLELAVAMTTGRDVLGVTLDRPRNVLYVDFENDPKADVRERLQAMNVGPDDLAHLHYLSYPTLAALDSERGGLELMSAVREYGCEVVVVDTVSRAIAGEENENDTWLNFYRHTGLLIKQAGIALIRLDHSGKDESKGQRGGSAKSGDVDAIWRLSRITDDSYRLDCEAARMPITEKTLVLHRESTPLRHRVDALGRAAAVDIQVEAVVAALNALDVPLATTTRDAAELLRAAGNKARNGVIGKALKQRQNVIPDVWGSQGTAS